MNASLAVFMAELLRGSFAAGVLVLLILLTQWLFRKHLAPRWHCALWLLVVARLLPISFNSEVSLFNLFPSAAVPARESVSLRDLVTQPLRAAANPPAATAVDPTRNGETAASPAKGTAFAPNWDGPAAFFWLWLPGVVALTAHVAWVSFSFSRQLRGMRPITDVAVLEVLHTCCERMGVLRAPALVECANIASPALHGCFRPRLLLPAGFTTTFSAAELRFVLLHELAHLRRRDLLLNWVMTALQILHWFNPLVWLAFARWRIDREIACDAAALEASAADSNHAYGHTMLKLLETAAPPLRQPGVVGILEDKRQLSRRLKMITGFAPSRRPFVAAALLLVLAVVGLTDAQIAPPTTIAASTAPNPLAPPRAVAPFVLFLIHGGETMLGETPDEIALRRAQTDAEKRSAPKWQRAAQLLETSLAALSAEKNFHVAIYFERNVEAIGSRHGAGDTQAVAQTLDRLRRTAPRGGQNLAAAFGFIGRDLSSLPERVVLITDGLPNSANSGVTADQEAQRIKFFEAATKLLPPRVPVHTILLPLFPGDGATPGLYWELANATRGSLTSPARLGGAPRTHLAFVVDTSGSMRDPNSGGLWPIVLDTIEAALDANPQLVGVQLLDGDGRFVLGRGTGAGLEAWRPNNAETREAIRTRLRNYNQDTVSNPVPGVTNALRFLYDKNAPEMRMGITLLGDEFNSPDSASIALDRLAKLNPRDATGSRRIVIDAIGFPTTIRYQFSMGNTGLRFADVMRRIAHEHGGTFIALPDL